MIADAPFITFPLGLLFWLTFIGSKFVERPVLKTYGIIDEADQGSANFILWSSRISRGLAILLGLAVTPNLGDFYFFGLALMWTGQIIRWFCFRALGKNFTGVVTRPDRIHRDGIYRWIRHPAYTGGLIFVSGMGLAIGNIWSVLILLIPSLAATLYRVKVEESSLLQAKGSEYLHYMKQTKRFIPFIY